MNEADLLNVIYDTKAEVRVLLKKRKYEEAHGNDTSTMLQMGKEIKKARARIDAARARLWKGVKSQKRFTPMYSSSICRTGRVRPKSTSTR